jgi:hypothetical protein
MQLISEIWPEWTAVFSQIEKEPLDSVKQWYLANASPSSSIQNSAGN